MFRPGRDAGIRFTARSDCAKILVKERQKRNSIERGVCRMKKLKKQKKRRLLRSAVFVAVLCVWLYWGNTSVQTTSIEIGSEEIPEEFDGFTIVQVSDLHNAEFGAHQERLLRAIQEASPDMIAVTGDLIDSNRTDVAKAMELIYGALQIAPVYYVTGNHEARCDQYAELKKQMTEAGVDLLEDEQIPLTRGGASIRLAGLNDPRFTAASDVREDTAADGKLKELLQEGEGYTVLLSHRPELFDVYADNGVNLVLSGHAHGGQVRLPFIGGIVAPNQGFFPQYSEGVHEKGQTQMVVSRGLGNSIAPLRIHNRPELIVVKLRQQKTSES